MTTRLKRPLRLSRPAHRPSKAAPRKVGSKGPAGAPSAKSAPAAPDWAAANVFGEARIAAWEGSTGPLRVHSIHPRRGSFLDTLYPKGNDAMAWHELIHPIDKQRVDRFFDRLCTPPLPASIDYRVIDRNGSVLWVRHSVLSAEAGHVRGFVACIQSEKEFQLESLRVSEREQNRIGQDLHDDLCQVLAGLSCLMRVVESRIASKLPGEVESMKEINQQIVDAMHRTRALTHGLFPGKGQMANIRGALLELASQVRTRFKVDITTQFAGRFPKHSPEQTIQIYRLTQEAMSNAIKHGRASRIDVRLEAKADEMVLTVKDNGSGFAQAAPAESGVGLHIMRYRAASIGGEVEIANATGGGVLATLRYPFES